MLKKFRNHLESNFPNLRNSKLLIACSGGMDSVALLHLISKVQDDLNISPAVVYINHNLREDAEKEEIFIDKVCKELSIPYYIDRISESTWANKSNMEARARTLRYSLIGKIAKANNFKYVATAHHFDDQLETILMRMFDRGTGVRGLVGIQSEIKIGDFIYLRPMLSVRKSEIEEYVKGKEYCFDTSNEDLNIKRNLYRNRIIPELSNILPDNYSNHIIKMSKNIARENSFTQELAKQFWENKKIEKDSYYIKRSVIEAYSDDFWISALSWLFSLTHNYSHSTNTLEDILCFIKKKEPAKCNYNPFNFERSRDGVSFFVE